MKRSYQAMTFPLSETEDNYEFVSKKGLQYHFSEEEEEKQTKQKQKNERTDKTEDFLERGLTRRSTQVICMSISLCHN